MLEACLKGLDRLRSDAVISQMPSGCGGDKRAVFCKSEQVGAVQFCVFTGKVQRPTGSGGGRAQGGDVKISFDSSGRTALLETLGR